MKSINNTLVKINILAVSLSAIVLACGCGKKSEHAAAVAQAPAVKVMTPIVKRTDIWDEYTARIDAFAFVELRSRVGGYLQKVNFTEGQIVKEGDLLFQIDPRPYEAALESCQAIIKEVEARLLLAENNLKRAKELLAANAISKETYETRNSELLGAKASLVNAQAKVREAQLNLEFTEIRAPLDGRVSEARVDAGNLISANSTLLTTIVRDDIVQAYFEISERDIMAYRKNGLFDRIDIMKKTGPAVELHMLGDSSTTPVKKGVLNYYDNRIGVQTSSLTLRADFDNADRILSPGMFAKARVLVMKDVDVTLLPEDVIGTDLVNRYVVVVDKDNIAQYRPLKVGRLLGKYRVIESGVSPTDRVVAVGLQRAIPGIKLSPELMKSE